MNLKPYAIFYKVRVEGDGKPILYYDFTKPINGTTVPDLSGNGNNGTIYNTIPLVKQPKRKIPVLR